MNSTLNLVTFGFISYFERSLLSVLDAFCRITGPMNERGICVVLLGFQIICCCFGLFLRHFVAHAMYDNGFVVNQ